MAKTKRTKAQLIEENDRFRAELGTQRPVEAEPASPRDIFREERYRAILDGITEGYYEVDLAGNFTFFNAAMSRMLGYAPSKLVGMNYRVYLDGEDARKVYEVFGRVFQTGEPEMGFDYELIRKDGSRVPHRGIGFADPGHRRPAFGLSGACARYHRPQARRGGLAQERAEIPPDRREHPRHLLPLRPRGEARHGEPVRHDQAWL